MKFKCPLSLIPALMGLFLLFAAPACRAGIRIVQQPDSYPKAVYVIAVGVNNYHSHPDLFPNLAFGVADAQGFADAIQTGWKSAGVPTDVQLLLDDNFTNASLQKAFAHVAAYATADDLFIFYFAGIGTVAERSRSTESEYYLLTGHCNGPDPGLMQQLVKKYAISASLLKADCAKIQVRKQLIVLDAGDARNELDAFVEQAVQSTAEQEFTQKNVALLTTEGAGMESSELKHGCLTYSLLQGLAGQAILSSRFKGITAREMSAYLPVSIIKFSDGLQLFRSYSWGDDFAIAPLPNIASVPPAEAPLRQTAPVEAPSSPTEEKSSQPGKNYALIFATDHYDEFKALSNPIHDAVSLGDELRAQYGFQVEVVQNPTQVSILTRLSQYRKRNYGPNDQLFIFFAGHGTKGNGDGYIVARDSKKQDDFYQSYIQYASLKNALTTFPCPHILLALDVCYGGNFANSSVQRWPVTLLQPRLHWAGFTLMPEMAGPSPDALRQAVRLMKNNSRVFLSSGQDVPVPDGAPGGHSPFMERLLYALDQARQQNIFITARHVFETLGTPTEPEYKNFDNRYPDGNFVFVPVGAVAPAL